MSVISNRVAMPNRIAIACEYLNYLGPTGGSRETIENLLSPLKKARNDEDDDKPSGRSIAADVLSEIASLGFLVNNKDSTITLADEIRSIAPSNDNWQEALRPVLFKKFFAPIDADLQGQSDVPEAISWLLVQDPFDPLPRGGGLHVERIVSQLGNSDLLRTAIGNNSRFQNLLYWSRYLGCAEWLGLKTGNFVVPDPTSAISHCLPDIFREETELPINAFVTRLGNLCSVLEEGKSRTLLENRLTSQTQRKERHLSRSTSLALRRLQLRGQIGIRAFSDSTTWVLDFPNETQGISHISLIARGAK